MTTGAVTDISRERDWALRRLQVPAAEIRAHEQTTRRNLAWSPRVDERLHRRLRQVNGGSHDADEEAVPLTGYPPALLPYG
jgi:hypothetical protein